MEFLNKVISVLARLLPLAAEQNIKINATKLLLVSFVGGFIFAYFFNFSIKLLFKKLKKKIKELKRDKRISSAIKVPNGKYIGEITQYLSKINVAVILVKKHKLNVGDTVLIKGPRTELLQKIESMQIDRKNVTVVKKGHEAGILVESIVKTGDLVFKIKK